MSDFVKRLRHVKLADVLEFWKLMIVFIPAIVYKVLARDLWIICEDPNEARDNGYWIFKYIRVNHPEQDCVYAIKSSSPDYQKVKSLGKTVEYGSLKHWLLYLASSKKISSQKAGNPNAAIFYVLEVYGLLKDKRIFLQHGVIINDLQWLYYNNTKINKFICGAYMEYMYVCEKFGYPNKSVVYTGLCRFDGLHGLNNSDERIILIMPTWREWIQPNDYRLKKIEGTTDVTKTNYFIHWMDFINDPRIKEYIKKYNVKFVFFPHRNMQKYINYFKSLDESIEIAEAKKYDIQDLIKRADLMITDYSSVFFDMLYMKKPVIFYQFDYKTFRKEQYKEGYFKYNKNGFAKSYEKKDDVFVAIEGYIKGGFKVDKKFLEAHKEYFKLYDEENCRRVYDVIKNA